jgi:hypothetical protein
MKRATDAMLHPIVLAALAAWLVNDHYLKAAHPSWLTGKLSDVTSLIVFPLILLAVLERWRTPGPIWRYGWLIATGAVMLTINLFDPAAWAYRNGLACLQWPFRAIWYVVHGDGVPGLAPVQLTMDPTDLLTLPALLVPWWLTRSDYGSKTCRASASSVCGNAGPSARYS